MLLQDSQCPLLSGPMLLISSDYKDFDPDQLCRYQEEGYRVHYRQNADLKWFQEMADDIEANEPYAIIGLLSVAFPWGFFFSSPSRKKKKDKYIVLRCKTGGAQLSKSPTRDNSIWSPGSTRTEVQFISYLSSHSDNRLLPPCVYYSPSAYHAGKHINSRCATATT